MFRYKDSMACDLLDLTAGEVKMERRVQIKLVAVANVELKVGQEIDATLTLSENDFYTAEIEKGLVVLACTKGRTRRANRKGCSSSNCHPKTLNMSRVPPDLTEKPFGWWTIIHDFGFPPFPARLAHSPREHKGL